MANGIVKQNSASSFTLSRLAPRFQGIAQDLYWRVEECNLDLGPNPGSATVILGKTPGTTAEPMNTMALNQANTSWLKHGLRCVVEKYFPTGNGSFDKTVVFIGSVAQIDHDRDKNAIVVTLYDDRWLLRDIRIIGRWIYDPQRSTSDAYFQQGWGAHFNPGGRPNCIYADVGTDGVLPFFTPYPDYGLTDGQQPPSPENRDKTKASYWTLQGIFEYLWQVYSGNGITEARFNGSFAWIAQAPDTLIWPKEFASGLDAQLTANFDTAIGQTNANKGDARKGREVVLEGFALLDAMSLLLQTGGGWDIGFMPHVSIGEDSQEVLKNILSIVPTRYTSNQNGISLPMVLGGDGSDLNRAVVTGGSFSESSVDFKSASAGAGQLVFIERMVSTKTADGAQLRPSWDQNARFDLFRTLAAGNNVTITDAAGNQIAVTGQGSASTRSLAQALRVFPDIMTTWCLNETFDFQSGTSESAFPRAPIKRPPWPTLLSLIGDAGGFDFAGMHAPIYVEIETSDNHWEVFGQFDSAEIFDNGNIYLPLMRELTSSPRVWQWAGTPFEVTDGKLSINLLNIRMSLAIPCDHRLIASFASPQDGLNGAEMFNDNPDVNRIADGFKRRDYRDLAGLYACWLRKSSYSRPQSLGWPQDPDKASGGSETDSLRSDFKTLQAHIRKGMQDVCRLQKGGKLRMDGYLVTTYAPGTAVKNLVDISNSFAPFAVNGVAKGYTLCCEEDKVCTELRF